MRVTVAACLLISALAPVASADCRPNPPPATALSEAAAVFVGRVVSAGRNGEWFTFEFEADFAWKGVAQRRVTVLSEEPGCARGYHFEVGTTYLVYARARPAGLVAEDCSRTEPLERAGPDLAELGRPPEVFSPKAGFPWLFVAGFMLGGGVVGLAAVALARRRRI
jgi:hypothetical protein